MKLTSLHALFVEQLKELYDAENQLLRALPKLAKVAVAPELRQAFTEQLHQTQVHVHRLDKIFLRLGVGPKGTNCRPMEVLAAESKDLVSDEAQATVFDAALIAAAQRMEHYQLASAGSARTSARILGHNNAADALQEMLVEKDAADKKLTELAETVVHGEVAAASGKS